MASFGKRKKERKQVGGYECVEVIHSLLYSREYMAKKIKPQIRMALLLLK